jgi:hypothetical protein
MRISSVVRVLLGLGFVVFATNYFIPFLPQPEPPPPAAMPFLAGFAGSGFLTFVKVIELGAGLLLLSNRFVPLALALLAPIVVGIMFVHVVLAPAGLPVAIVFLALEVITAWTYRGAFAPMLKAKTTPSPLVEKPVALDPIPVR